MAESTLIKSELKTTVTPFLVYFAFYEKKMGDFFKLNLPDIFE